MESMRLLAILRHLLIVVKLTIIVVGALALLNFAMINSSRPLLRVAQVDGVSMEPTLDHGEEAVFVRGPYKVGSIVLANVGDSQPVVKRVVVEVYGNIYLKGDNAEMTESYIVSPEDVLGVMAAHSGIRLPMLQADDIS